jgi:hypothetical protein
MRFLNNLHQVLSKSQDWKVKSFKRTPTQLLHDFTVQILVHAKTLLKDVYFYLLKYKITFEFHINSNRVGV